MSTANTEHSGTAGDIFGRTALVLNHVGMFVGKNDASGTIDMGHCQGIRSRALNTQKIGGFFWQK
jgi:hypothetical protein